MKKNYTLLNTEENSDIYHFLHAAEHARGACQKIISTEFETLLNQYNLNEPFSETIQNTITELTLTIKKYKSLLKDLEKTIHILTEAEKGNSITQEEYQVVTNQYTRIKGSKADKALLKLVINNKIEEKNTRKNTF